MTIKVIRDCVLGPKLPLGTVGEVYSDLPMNVAKVLVVEGVAVEVKSEPESAKPLSTETAAAVIEVERPKGRIRKG